MDIRFQEEVYYQIAQKLSIIGAELNKQLSNLPTYVPGGFDGDLTACRHQLQELAERAQNLSRGTNKALQILAACENKISSDCTTVETSRRSWAASAAVSAIDWIRGAIGIGNKACVPTNDDKLITVIDTEVKPQWPVINGKIIENRRFGAFSPNLPGDSAGGHKGIDIDGTRKDPIYPAVKGTVARAGWSDTYGNVVYINAEINGKHYQFRYAHLESISSEVKEALQSGKPIGSDITLGGMGDTPGKPYCDGVHLHFEVRESANEKPCSLDNSSTPIDPEVFLNQSFQSTITTAIF